MVPSFFFLRFKQYRHFMNYVNQDKVHLQQFYNFMYNSMYNFHIIYICIYIYLYIYIYTLCYKHYYMCDWYYENLAICYHEKLHKKIS